VHRHLEVSRCPEIETAKLWPASIPAVRGRIGSHWPWIGPPFETRTGEAVTLDRDFLARWPEVEAERGALVPVFINEAAYREKGTTLSFAVRVRWPFSQGWLLALSLLLGSPSQGSSALPGWGDVSAVGPL